MSALTLHVLRRLALFCLVAAFGLLVVPRILVEVGLLGPTASEAVQGAERAVTAARAYGAIAGMAPLDAAESELERARALAAAGDRREARKAAARASDHAIEAQKAALVSRSETRRRAEVVYNDLDRQINDLEKLYSSVSPGLQKEQTQQLVSLMKVTRSSAALLFLAYEQQDYGRVLEGEQQARDIIASTRTALEGFHR